MTKSKKCAEIAKITINTSLEAAGLVDWKDNWKHSVNTNVLTETWIKYDIKTDNEVKKDVSM